VGPRGRRRAHRHERDLRHPLLAAPAVPLRRRVISVVQPLRCKRWFSREGWRRGCGRGR
jgi:hypothetical protein